MTRTDAELVSIIKARDATIRALSDQHRGYLRDRVAKEAIIVEMKQWAQAAQESLLAKEAALQALDQGGQTANKGLHEKEAIIQQLREALKSNEHAMQAKEYILAELHEHGGRMRADFEEKEASLCDALQEHELAYRKTIAAEFKRMNAEHQAQLNDLREELKPLRSAFAVLDLVHLHATVDTQRRLMQELEQKEAVIRELHAAVKAYRAARSWRVLQRLRSAWARSKQWFRAMTMPKLGSLYQHPPIELVLPARYGKEKAPANPPRISIATPSFGQGAFIERTLRSVLDQNYPGLEYFVQDGGSQDGTIDVLERYSDQLSGWEAARDGGQSHAINMGLARTTGEIMAWLNSDDVLLPGALAYVANYFAQHPDVDVVYGHRLLIDENDKQIGRWIMPAHDDEVLSWVDFVPQETLFWRRRIWDKVGGQVDESFRFAMDWDLLVRFRDAGATFARLPRALGGFRIHTQQKTSAQISDIGMREMDRIRMRTLGLQPSSKQIRAAIAPYLVRHILADWSWRVRSLGGEHRGFALGSQGSQEERN